ncbi:MAG: sulfite exporter TauE/SafE family protein [Thermoproteota archaeon]
MNFATLVICFLISFISQYLDSSLGMGYGTFTAPLLLLLGIPPFYAVPTILLTKVFLGLISGGAHKMAGNIQPKIFRSLVLTGIPGTAIGVTVSIMLPQKGSTAFIGLIMMVVGFLTLFYTIRGIKMGKYSENKIRISGLLAGFTNGISGGGYGAISATGLILGGVDPSKAVGSTLLAEALIALSGIFMYGFLLPEVNWMLVLPLLVGGLIATPVGILTTRKMSPRKLGTAIGSAVLVLGGLSASVRSEAFVTGFVLIALVMMTYHLLMVGYLRVRVAIGGANIGIGSFVLVVIHFIRTGIIPHHLPGVWGDLLIFGLAFGGVTHLLAGILNATAKGDEENF